MVEQAVQDVRYVPRGRANHLNVVGASYRMERPVIRAGLAPAEDPSLFTAHCYGKANSCAAPRSPSDHLPVGLYQRAGYDNVLPYAQLK